MKSTQPSKDKAFTLLEVMVAMMILGLVAAGMAPVFINHLKTNTRAELKTESIAVAQQVLDELRSQDPTNFPMSGSDAPILVDGGSRSYTVIVSYCKVTSYCASANTRHIEVAVRYMGSTIYEVETVYTKLK